jgi:hypothetical protein
MPAQNVPARIAMEILRHAQIGTTMNIYAHVPPTFSAKLRNEWQMLCGAKRERVAVKYAVNLGCD